MNTTWNNVLYYGRGCLYKLNVIKIQSFTFKKIYPKNKGVGGYFTNIFWFKPTSSRLSDKTLPNQKNFLHLSFILNHPKLPKIINIQSNILPLLYQHISLCTTVQSTVQTPSLTLLFTKLSIRNHLLFLNHIPNHNSI